MPRLRNRIRRLAIAALLAAGTFAAPALGAGMFTLVGLDNGATFVAQTNPKEIAIDKAVPWTRAPTSTGDQPELQFRQATGRTMTFTLEFDTSADGTDVHGAYVSQLAALAMVMDPGASAPEQRKRPTRVKVTAGAGAIAFEGVIASIETRYTQFLPDGTPVRATCEVTLKEASRASFVKP